MVERLCVFTGSAISSANRFSRRRVVEIGLGDDNSLGHRHSRDVAYHSRSVGNQVVNLDYSELVTPRALNPGELACREESNLCIGGTDPNHRAALGVTALRGDVLDYPELRPKTKIHSELGLGQTKSLHESLDGAWSVATNSSALMPAGPPQRET